MGASIKYFLILTLGINIYDINAQPLDFKVSVEIHRDVLIEEIENNLFTSDKALKIALTTQANIICNYALNHFIETGSYINSRDLLRSMIKEEFITHHKDIIEEINHRITKTYLDIKLRDRVKIPDN